MRHHRHKPDYARIAAMERDLGLPATEECPAHFMPERPKIKLRNDDLIFDKAEIVVIVIIIIFMVAIIYAAAKKDTGRVSVSIPNSLPSGVMVGPGTSFIVPKGMSEAYEKVLCANEEVERPSLPIGKNREIMICEEANKFTFTQKEVYRP